MTDTNTVKEGDDDEETLLPEGWSAHEAAEYGQRYYAHAASGVVQWNRPLVGLCVPNSPDVPLPPALPSSMLLRKLSSLATPSQLDSDSAEATLDKDKQSRQVDEMACNVAASSVREAKDEAEKAEQVVAAVEGMVISKREMYGNDEKKKKSETDALPLSDEIFPDLQVAALSPETLSCAVEESQPVSKWSRVPTSSSLGPPTIYKSFLAIANSTLVLPAWLRLKVPSTVAYHYRQSQYNTGTQRSRNRFRIGRTSTARKMRCDQLTSSQSHENAHGSDEKSLLPQWQSCNCQQSRLCIMHDVNIRQELLNHLRNHTSPLQIANTSNVHSPHTPILWHHKPSAPFIDEAPQQKHRKEQTGDPRSSHQILESQNTSVQVDAVLTPEKVDVDLNPDADNTAPLMTKDEEDWSFIPPADQSTPVIDDNDEEPRASKMTTGLFFSPDFEDSSNLQFPSPELATSNKQPQTAYDQSRSVLNDDLKRHNYTEDTSKANEIANKSWFDKNRQKVSIEYHPNVGTYAHSETSFPRRQSSLFSRSSRVIENQSKLTYEQREGAERWNRVPSSSSSFVGENKRRSKNRNRSWSEDVTTASDIKGDPDISSQHESTSTSLENRYKQLILAHATQFRLSCEQGETIAMNLLTGNVAFRIVVDKPYENSRKVIAITDSTGRVIYQLRSRDIISNGNNKNDSGRPRRRYAILRELPQFRIRDAMTDREVATIKQRRGMFVDSLNVRPFTSVSRAFSNLTWNTTHHTNASNIESFDVIRRKSDGSVFNIQHAGSKNIIATATRIEDNYGLDENGISCGSTRIVHIRSNENAPFILLIITAAVEALDAD